MIIILRNDHYFKECLGREYEVVLKEVHLSNSSISMALLVLPIPGFRSPLVVVVIEE